MFYEPLLEGEGSMKAYFFFFFWFYLLLFTRNEAFVFLPSWLKWSFILTLSFAGLGLEALPFSNLAPVVFPQKQTHSREQCYLGNCHFW